MYPQVFGKYVLERELARGGMARVVLATLRGAGGFEKRLVVKQIRDELATDNEFVRRFVEEAKTTVSLSHPNIVPVYELGVEQGTYFLAMELVEGVSVAELLRERNEDGSRRVLTPEEGAYVGMEVCRALDYAHRRMKVVHRDITPRNVMIDDEGQIKLIDFGIAAPALVAGQEILGSPGHMAPEQLDGGELGPPTDIFAVAVFLMEAWTGVAPFRRATPEECAVAVREPHPMPSDFDPRLLPLDEQISRALSIDPRERQQEASELARALRLFLQGVDVADIARALGDRVRDLRESAAVPSPPSRATGPRPSLASHGDLGTRTFAAREEAMRWSDPPPSLDDVPIPSTRALPGSTPKLPSVHVAPSRPDDPAMGIPTPLMVDVDELERIHQEIERRASEVDSGPLPDTPVSSTASAPPPAIRQTDVPTVRRPKFERPRPKVVDEKLETIATRPIETPVREFDPSRRDKAPQSRLLGRLAPVVILVAAGAAGFALFRSRSTNDTTPPTSSAPTTNATSPKATAEPSTSAPPSSPPSSVPSTSPSATPPITTSTSSGASSAAVGKASISLLGDPGTRVWVDGTARGTCPARIAVDSGSHEVKFTFEPTGESLVERFTAKSGDHVTVRAQFAGATPTVKIIR